MAVAVAVAAVEVEVEIQEEEEAEAGGELGSLAPAGYPGNRAGVT